MNPRRSSRVTVALLAVALVVTVVGIVNQVLFTSAQQARNACYQAAFDAFVVAVDRIDQAAAGERRAQRDLLSAVFADETAEQRRTAFDRYFTVLDRADQIRDDTTLIPEGGCR